MLLKRFYDTRLAQASYLVGCQATGEAIVVDPNRDVEQYLRGAVDEGLRVTHVTETHIHADFVSGSRELAARAGARLLLSDEGGEDWRYRFAESDGATLLHDGDRIDVGHVRLAVHHTPGHTPEHLSFIVTDTAVTDRPMGALTGDFIFVGDVGRPDLLERAANVSGSMEEGARSLFASLQRFKTLPDYLQLWPGHGAGSACGKALGAVPSSSLGYERIVNWGLAATNEAEFVRNVLAGQPEPPRYFACMKRINRDGPRALLGFPPPERRDPDTLAEILRAGMFVVDTRPAMDFATGHVPGTINIPLNRSFSTWSGSLLPYDRDVMLIAAGGDRESVSEAARDLAMIGLDRITGFFDQEALTRWAATEGDLATIAQLAVVELSDRMTRETIQVVDVRGAAEWSAGHLPGVANIPLGALADRLSELARDRPVVLHCQGGGRSAIGASILQANGFEQVFNLSGGFGEWQAKGLPVEQG